MPLACFQGVDTLRIASKHAEGMSLRYDESLISNFYFPTVVGALNLFNGGRGNWAISGDFGIKFGESLKIIGKKFAYV